MKKYRLTTRAKQKCESKALRRSSAEPDQRQIKEIDAIIDAYLKQWTDPSTLTKPAEPTEAARSATTCADDKGPANGIECLRIQTEAKVIFLAAIVAGISQDEARYLARLNERQADHLIAGKEFGNKIEAGRARSSALCWFDLIIALQERDAWEAAAEYADGDFHEYMRMCEDGRMEEITILVEAAAMRAAGRWYLVPASRRLEIQEIALRDHSNAARRRLVP